MNPILFILMFLQSLAKKAQSTTKTVSTIAAVTIVAVGAGYFLMPDGQSIAIPPLYENGTDVYIDTPELYLSSTATLQSGDQYLYLTFVPKNMSTEIDIYLLMNKEYVQPTGKLELYDVRNVSVRKSYVCPYTMNFSTSQGHFWCYVPNASGNIVVFNHSYTGRNVTNKTAWWNDVEEQEWRVLNGEYDKVKRDINGKDTVWRLGGRNVTLGQTYRARVPVYVPYLPVGKTQDQAFPDFNPKFDVVIIPTAYRGNLDGAISDGQVFVLDPVTNLTYGLEYHWRLDANSRTQPDAHGRVNATVHGNVNLNATGKLNRSISTNGTSNTFNIYANTSTAQGWYFTEEFTIAGWLNMTADSTNDITIWVGRNSSQGKRLQLFIRNSNAWLIQLGHDAAQNDVSPGTYDISDNQFKLIVFQRKNYGGTYYCTLFVNNTMAWNASCNAYASGSVSTNNQVWACSVIGSGCGSGTHNFPGHMDSLSYWSYALNRTSITDLWNNSAGIDYPFTDAPVAASTNVSIYFTFNESNKTFNHNLTPTMLYMDFNVSNSTPNCQLVNFSSNNTAWPVSSSTGIVNISGPNISRTGVYSVSFSALDNCSNRVYQNITLNVTNTNPTNNASANNLTFNHNASFTSVQLCRDGDNDVVTRSINLTAVSFLSNGSVTFSGPNITPSGFYTVVVGCYDGLVNSTSTMTINITNTAPVNNWSSNNQSFNHNQSIIFGGYCNDPDNDALVYTGNVSNLPMLSNGSINFTAAIAKTGLYFLQAGCSDTLVNSTAVARINVTNTAPSVSCTNSSFRYYLNRSICSFSDPDNDAVVASVNSTFFAVTGMNITYRANESAIGNRTLIVGVSDTVVNTTSFVQANISNISANFIALCPGVPVLRFIPNVSLVNFTTGRTTQSRLANGTTQCTFVVNATTESIPLLVEARNNYTNSGYVLQLGTVNLTDGFQTVQTVTSGNVSVFNLTGYWVNSSYATFPFVLRFRVSS